MLSTLRFRRLRGDAIEVYKILSGIFGTSLNKMFYMVQDSTTRGSYLNIDKQHVMTNLKQNTLHDYVVTVSSMNSIKHRLDCIWHDHAWRFDFEYDLGTSITLFIQ